MYIKIDINDEELTTIESGLKRLREIMEEAEKIVNEIRYTTYFNLEAKTSADNAETSPAEQS